MVRVRGWVGAAVAALAVAAGCSGSGAATTTTSPRVPSTAPKRVVEFDVTPTEPVSPSALEALRSTVAARMLATRPGEVTAVVRGFAVFVRVTEPTIPVDQLRATLAAPGAFTLQPVSATSDVERPAYSVGADGRWYRLGPLFAQNRDVATAAAEGGTAGWQVRIWIIRGSQAAVNAGLAECFKAVTNCTTRQMAVVLDGKVLSAPQVNAESLAAQSLLLDAGADRAEARMISTLASAPPLPVGVTVRVA